jgi:hypothetical protein
MGGAQPSNPRPSATPPPIAESFITTNPDRPVVHDANAPLAGSKELGSARAVARMDHEDGHPYIGHDEAFPVVGWTLGPERRDVE